MSEHSTATHMRTSDRRARFPRAFSRRARIVSASLVLAAFAAHGTAAPTDATSRAERCFTSLGDVVRGMPGTRVAYRFRRVTADCGGAERAIERVWDGVVRLVFRDDGLFVEMVHLDGERDEMFATVPRRVVTYYSYYSGEYARLEEQAHGLIGSVVLDHFKNLPAIALYASGAVGPRSALRECSPIAAVDSETSVFRNAVGLELSVRAFDENERGVRRLTLGARDDQRSERITLIGPPGSTDAGPWQPDFALHGRVDDKGCAFQVETWQRIEGAWDESELSTSIGVGASVMDYRAPGGGSVRALGLDRPTELADLLRWNAIEHVPAGLVEYKPGAEEPIAPSRSGVLVPTAAVLALLAAIVLARSAFTRAPRNATGG